MPTQEVEIKISVKWTRLRNGLSEPYKWGDRKDSSVEPNWSLSSLIYRWVRNSTEEVAEIGETERTLTQRTNNYISATPKSSAGGTNKKVYNEQHRLLQQGDCLNLEFTDDVPGYNLNDRRERRLAESLLVGYTKPYLQ